ncbi:hypothetical protein PIROE2DRAFT_57106 [Piromyces sp. E2]|nr:hypothetical protein PIROE2DRAFT_57106 [Piromyces sp. E2]|eukprot:OUM70057.1 hypothetical protein PIROE2DRAFT_57106 [Piromyces sp. E2]
MGGDPTKVKKDKKSQMQYDDKNQYDQTNQQEGMPIGMCPPQSLDPGFISNGGVMYPIAPAAIYPGNPPYPIPVTYPQVYPYPVYPPAYQDDHNIHYSSRSKPKFRKASRHSEPPSQPIKKNYRFVKSSRNRNPYQSRFRVNEPSYHPRRRSRERYYYEDDDRDDLYDMVEDDDSYFDEDYGY